MKKYTLIGVVVALSIFNLAVALAQDPEFEAPLKCESLTGCRTSAQCPGTGTPSGCNVACADGSFVICPAGP